MSRVSPSATARTDRTPLIIWLSLGIVLTIVVGWGVYVLAQPSNGLPPIDTTTTTSSSTSSSSTSSTSSSSSSTATSSTSSTSTTATGTTSTTATSSSSTTSSVSSTTSSASSTSSTGSTSSTSSSSSTTSSSTSSTTTTTTGPGENTVRMLGYNGGSFFYWYNTSAAPENEIYVNYSAPFELNSTISFEGGYTYSGDLDGFWNSEGTYTYANTPYTFNVPIEMTTITFVNITLDITLQRENDNKTYYFHDYNATVYKVDTNFVTEYEHPVLNFTITLTRINVITTMQESTEVITSIEVITNIKQSTGVNSHTVRFKYTPSPADPLEYLGVDIIPYLIGSMAFAVVIVARIISSKNKFR